MNLSVQSRVLKASKRVGEIQRQRGVTFPGQKIWEVWEDAIVRQTRHLTVAETRKQLQHRSVIAIDGRRRDLGLYRRKLKQWTTHEDRLLRSNIETMDFIRIAKLLPGRSANAVQGRAWYLGYRKGTRRKVPKVTGLPVYDEVRRRAFEDGLTMRALDMELQTGKYFRDNFRKVLNWKKLSAAVQFFGGRLTVDWQDE